jgi:hypothetical protein
VSCSNILALGPSRTFISWPSSSLSARQHSAIMANRLSVYKAIRLYKNFITVWTWPSASRTQLQRAKYERDRSTEWATLSVLPGADDKLYCLYRKHSSKLLVPYLQYMHWLHKSLFCNREQTMKSFIVTVKLKKGLYTKDSLANVFRAVVRIASCCRSFHGISQGTGLSASPPSHHMTRRIFYFCALKVTCFLTAMHLY